VNGVSFLIFSVVFLLGIIVYFKYWNKGR